jgi:hypothetical protein
MLTRMQHDALRIKGSAVVEINHVLIERTDALSRGNCAMDPVQGATAAVLQIEGA